VAGPAALARIQRDFETLKNAAALLNAPEDQVYARLESLRDGQKLLEKQISELKQKLASGGSTAADEIREAAGVRYIARAVDGLESNEAKQVADELRGKVKSGVVVLGISKGAKASLLVALTPDLVGRLDAGKIIRELAPLIGGGGGGRKDIAEAGGKSPEKIPEALAAVGGVIEKMLAG
jgi:alanyl-tRNA synthetase